MFKLITLFLICVFSFTGLGGGVIQDPSGVGNNHLTTLIFNGSGTTFNDVANGGSASTCTPANGASWSGGQQRFGKNTMLFDGGDQRLVVSDNDDLALGTVWTISFWLYPTAIADADAVFAQWIDGNNYMAMFSNGTSGDYRFYIRSGGTFNFQSTFTNDKVVVNQWNHIEFANDGVRGYVFRNGNLLVGEPSLNYASGGNFPNYASDLWLGDDANPGGRDMTGYIAVFKYTKGRVLHNRSFTVPKRAEI